ncbi:MAG: hypothetical protein GF308_14685 [Candidatus Heimdallarchaeota archaeon]|nr:hypothetical protein [Candidatus Heimdallarchaeota archaeon]
MKWKKPVLFISLTIILAVIVVLLTAYKASPEGLMITWQIILIGVSIALGGALIGACIDRIIDMWLERKKELEKTYEFCWKPKRKLTQEDVLGHTRVIAGKESKNIYKEREVDGKLMEILKENKENVLILGPSLSGKSRLVHHTLTEIDKRVFVTKPSKKDPDLEEFRMPFFPIHTLNGKITENILLVDDLFTYSTNYYNFDKLLEKFQKRKDIRIIATCRTGVQFEKTKKALKNKIKLDKYFPAHNRLNVEEISEEEAREITSEAGIEWDKVEFDGTIGSIFLAFDEMRDKIREDCRIEEHIILKSIKGAYLAGLRLGENMFPIEWVKNIVEKKFELILRQYEWDHQKLVHLEELELIRLEEEKEIKSVYRYLFIEEKYLKKVIGKKDIPLEREEPKEKEEEDEEEEEKEKFSVSELEEYYNYFDVREDLEELQKRVQSKNGVDLGKHIKSFQELLKKKESIDVEIGWKKYNEEIRKLKPILSDEIRPALRGDYKEFLKLLDRFRARALIESRLKLARYFARYKKLLAIFLSHEGYAELINHRKKILEEAKNMDKKINEKLHLLRISTDSGPYNQNIMPIAYIDLNPMNKVFNSETGCDFLGDFHEDFTGKVKVGQTQKYLVEDKDEEITKLIYGDNVGRDVYIFKNLSFENDVPKISAGMVKFRYVVKTTEVLFFKTFEEKYAGSFINAMQERNLNPFLTGLGRASAIAVDTVVIFAIEREEHKEGEKHKDYYAFVNKRSVGVRTYPEFYHVFPSSHFGPDLDDDNKEQFDCYLNFEREYLEEFFNYDGFDDSISCLREEHAERLDEIKHSENVDHFYTGIFFDIINFHPAICTVLIIHDPNWILNHATKKLERKLKITVNEDPDRFALNFESKDHLTIPLIKDGQKRSKEAILQSLKELNDKIFSLGQLMPPDGFGTFNLGLEKFYEIMNDREV